MKKLIVISLFFSCAVWANNSVLTDSLKSWQPLDIVKNDSELTIVLNERRITDVIYDAIVENGICMPLWLDKNEEYLREVKSINVVNMYKKQGYIFENPLGACKSIGEATGNTGKIILMGNSSVF